MQQNNGLSQLAALDNFPLQVAWKVKLDLRILGYMAQKMHVHLLKSTTSTSNTLPSIHFAEEHRNRIHRMVIYKQQEFLLHRSLLFVGFISGIQQHVGPAIVQEIHRVDKLFMAELANNPGLLSYSSLELNKGHWYNLVLLNNQAAKKYFKDSSTHTYAAYQLAMNYYAWIRLHNGVMLCGLQGNALVLQSTKYYSFPEIG
ncbi:MAG: hypothetical protein NVS3B14_04390 [Ktedonobacteraceae bacterium]